MFFKWLIHKFMLIFAFHCKNKHWKNIPLRRNMIENWWNLCKLLETHSKKNVDSYSKNYNIGHKWNFMWKKFACMNTFFSWKTHISLNRLLLKMIENMENCKTYLTDRTQSGMSCLNHLENITKFNRMIAKNNMKYSFEKSCNTQYDTKTKKKHWKKHREKKNIWSNAIRI